MKKITLYSLCLVLASSLSNYAFAQTPQQFIQQVYADALNEDLISIDIIKLHAAPPLRTLIQQRDAIAEAHEGEMCEWVYDAYPLIPGNDYDTRLEDMSFTQLNNGRIRAKGQNFGEAFHIDFEVACTAKGCKITNLYSPQDYKKTMQAIVQAGRC